MSTRAGLAVILAGGHGTRLAGDVSRIDKGAVQLAGYALWYRVAERLSPQSERLGVCASHPPDWLAALPEDTLSITDALAEDGKPQGPAWALATALKAAHAISPDLSVLTVPVDSPFLPLDLYARLKAGMEEIGVEAAIAGTSERLHPVFGLWKAALAPKVRELIEVNGIRAMHALAETIGAATVRAWREDMAPPPFLNINTPEDLSQAKKLSDEFEPASVFRMRAGLRQK